MASLMSWIQRALCSLRGHDQLLEFEVDRMFLRCASCGHATHGWEIGTAVTQQWQRAPVSVPVRHAVPQLARQRQAA